eukprot:3393385-Alexandrium_andersonii.AAC.1
MGVPPRFFARPWPSRRTSSSRVPRPTANSSTRSMKTASSVAVWERWRASGCWRSCAAKGS